MSEPVAVVAEAPSAEGNGPLVDWLAWGGSDADVRRWVRRAGGPDGPLAAARRPGAPRAPAPSAVYAAEVRVDELVLPSARLPDTITLLGIREAVVFTNPTDRPLDVVHLRVFPAVAAQPTRPVHVNGVWAGGLATPFVLEDSLLSVRTPRPLRPGEQLRLLVELVEPLPRFFPQAPVETPTWSPVRGGVVGVADDQIALGPFLPTVTAFLPGGPDTRAVEGNELPDVYDPAWWVVSLTHPTGYTLASTGVEVASTQDDRRVTVQVVAAARDFAAHLVPEASVETVDVGGTRLRVVWRDRQRLEGLVGQDLLRLGEEMLRVYAERFGPLDAAEVDIVEGPIRGVPELDFPGLVVVDARHAHAPYHRSAAHEWALAHGLAHQWWGHDFGNDGVAEPWIDEGLAEHAAALYWESRYGRGAVADRYAVEVEEPVGRLVAHGIELLPGTLPAASYDIGRYPVLVHGRSSLFFDGLRRSWGDPAWTAALRDLRAAGSGRRLAGPAVLRVLSGRAPAGFDLDEVFLGQMVSPAWLTDLVEPP